MVATPLENSLVLFCVRLMRNRVPLLLVARVLAPAKHRYGSLFLYCLHILLGVVEIRLTLISFLNPLGMITNISQTIKNELSGLLGLEMDVAEILCSISLSVFIEGRRFLSLGCRFLH